MKIKSLYDWCIRTSNTYLLDEWDYEKNIEIDPTNITTGVDLKVWWKCKGHSYKSQIRSRTVLKIRCPICYKG